MTRFRADHRGDRGSRSSVSIARPGTCATGIDQSGGASEVRTRLPVIKAVAVVLLIVWTLLTLLKWAGDEAALDAAPRVAMDDFISAYREVYMSPTLSREEPDEPHERAQGLYVVDVRGENAYIDGHIRGALSLPEAELEGRVRSLVPDLASTVMLYCA